MISFEETAQILDEIVESIPETLLEGLNGGIVLLPDTRRSPNIPSGRHYTLGTYHTHKVMGKWIELYYGSFAALYPYASRERLRSELERVVHHELRHHIETRAGCNDLAREDARYVEKELEKLRCNETQGSTQLEYHMPK